jgi:hypothetical protein
MSSNNRVAAITSEFDDFLYASIDDDFNGMPLSMLSALARLNVDPWEEAGRLARMPRDLAIGALATLLAALPQGLAERPDSGSLARRMVALLPQQAESRTLSTAATSVTELRGKFHVFTLFLASYVIFSILFAAAQWLMGAPDKNTPSDIAPPTASAAVSLDHPTDSSH